MSRYYITAAKLRKWRACGEQIELFVQTFGEGRVLVNLANVRKAMAAGLDVTWPARQPFLQARWHSHEERSVYQLWFQQACHANTAPQILACLNAALRIECADGFSISAIASFQTGGAK